MILFFDTETTGLPDFRAPSDAKHQPHIVQLAALLTEDDGTERSSMSLIIDPDGFDIPEDASAIHGITKEIAMRSGVPIADAVAVFTNLRRQADMRVAHNIAFDDRLLRIAALRCGSTRERIEEQEKLPRFCTMKAATPILALPPTQKMLDANFNRPKPPKLEEAYHHFFCRDLVGAHDAMVDVRACKEVFFAIRSLEREAE